MTSVSRSLSVFLSTAISASSLGILSASSASSSVSLDQLAVMVALSSWFRRLSSSTRRLSRLSRRVAPILLSRLLLSSAIMADCLVICCSSSEVRPRTVAQRSRKRSSSRLAFRMASLREARSTWWRCSRSSRSRLRAASISSTWRPAASWIASNCARSCWASASALLSAAASFLRASLAATFCRLVCSVWRWSFSSSSLGTYSMAAAASVTARVSRSTARSTAARRLLPKSRMSRAAEAYR